HHDDGRSQELQVTGNERNSRRVTDVRVPKLMPRLHRAHSLVVLMAAFVLAACSGSTSAPQHSPSPLAGALSDGLIAYVSSQGVGVIDPGTGKSALVAPLPQAGAFRVAGPVWGPAPDAAYPVIY